VIGEVKDRVLVEFRDHLYFPVAPGGGYMLAKGVAIAAGCRPWYRRKDFHRVKIHTYRIQGT
jgi:hypothetical protein